MLTNSAYTLTTLPNPVDSLKEGESTDLNWDEYLDIKLIREHTRTDDVPGVTDAQLRLYRAAAVEAAEFYSGMVLSKQQVFSEIIDLPKLRPGKEYFTIKLKRPTSDGILYIYGNGQYPDTVHITPNTRKVRLQNRYYAPDMSNCCDPCAKATNGLRVMYRAGFSCPERVPPGILLGILQFVAWVVEHPGDEVLAMRNTLSARGGALIGTNNIALISGALESWRQFDPEAV